MKSNLSRSLGKSFKTPIIFLAFLLLSSCSKDEDPQPVYDVLEEFQPIVDTFIKEAAARGISLQITNLVIKYDSTLDPNTCGKCNSISKKPNIQKIISINSKNLCWKNAEEKETLLFHELGHCILGRDHTSQLLPNGDYKSIMTRDNRSLYAPCAYDIGEEFCDNRFKRNYYLDELFDEKTSVPDWGR